MKFLKSLFKTFGIGLLIGIGVALWLVVVVAPIIGAICIANIIGYWYIVLLTLAIIWACACIVTTIQYIVKFIDERS